MKHRGVGERGICWACVWKHLRAFAWGMLPIALGATGFFEYEHHHAAPAVVVSIGGNASPWENWPCDLSERGRRAQAPESVDPDICQSR